MARDYEKEADQSDLRQEYVKKILKIKKGKHLSRKEFEDILKI